MFQQFRESLLEARKHRDVRSIKLMSALVGELQANAKLVDGKKMISDGECIRLVKKYLKGVNEMLTIVLSEQSEFEKDLLESFLPKQMTEDELRRAIKPIADGGADNLGRIMKAMKMSYSGRYDGKLASSIAREFLR